MTPKVSVVIPARNEREKIARCLRSILENDYPREKLEIIVVDGMSEDGTAEVARSFEGVKVIENPKKYTPYALNMGISVSSGDVIMLAGAHTEYSRSYIRECVRTLKTGFDAAGGKMETLPGDETTKALAIARVLSHPLGTGAKYRTREFEDVTEVDTAPYALYKREVFERVGFFNEKLLRNQDIEFNLRMRRAGMKIALNPRARSYYYARSNFTSLFQNNFANGFWVIWSLRYAKLPFSFRHLVPMFFVLFISLWPFFFALSPFFGIFYSIVTSLYLTLVISASVKMTLEERSLPLFPLLIWAFFTLHVSYGLGSVWALLKFPFKRREE